jgi:hypothetical protein
MSRGAWLSSALLWAAVACAAPPAPVEPPPAAAANEPIRVARGARTVAVSCQLDCAPLRSELDHLAEGCRRDPLSTPHAVTPSSSAIGLGCCEEAASAYREGCGGETLGPCASEWLALCQHAYTAPASAISGGGS